MKKQFIAFGTLMIFLSACTNSSSEKKTDAAATVVKTDIKSVIKEDQLAMKKDPVCGMVVYKFLEDTTLYNGKIYGFCGNGCKVEFLKNPEEVLKAAEGKAEMKDAK